MCWRRLLLYEEKFLSFAYCFLTRFVVREIRRKYILEANSQKISLNSVKEGFASLEENIKLHINSSNLCFSFQSTTNTDPSARGNLMPWSIHKRHQATKENHWKWASIYFERVKCLIKAASDFCLEARKRTSDELWHSFEAEAAHNGFLFNTRR